jgi:hypothetical protein
MFPPEQSNPWKQPCNLQVTSSVNYYVQPETLGKKDDPIYLFYFILFYFILFYFILFYFIFLSLPPVGQSM